MFRQFGWLELLVILLIALLIFGPNKLPQLGKAIARTIREFRKTLAGEDEESNSGEREEKP
ncbi:MAG: twin-arginine translocase TatA/TatE family subunit [Chloroflexia bacterium]